MLRNIFWKVGVLGDYKRVFWKFALRRLARGEIEYLISSILVAHHLIMFSRARVGWAAPTLPIIRCGCGKPPFPPNSDGRERGTMKRWRLSSEPRELDLISA